MLITDTSKLKDFYSEHRVWQGIPGIARTVKGRIFVSFYSGNTGETYGNYAVLTVSEDENRFSEPIAVAYKEGAYRCFDPVLWLDPLGRLWFIWNVMPGEEVVASICEDPDAECLVWSKEFTIGRGIMMNKPTVLSTGEWLFPVAIWSHDIYGSIRQKALTPEDTPGAYVYKSSDNGKSFIKLGMAEIPNRSVDEHIIYEMRGGVLRMLVRQTNGIGESYSYDRAKQWSKGRATELGGPGSRFFIGRLRSGRVLLLNHYKFEGRNNLTALLSEDDGMTFPYSLLLDGRELVSYPDAVEGEGGEIYIVYDRDRGCFKPTLEAAYASEREILISRITEEDIIKGKLCSEGSYLGRIVSKLGKLAEGDPDPYSEEVRRERYALALMNDPSIDLLETIFERFPLDCTATSSEEFKRLDGLIARFKDSGSKDEKTLGEIIEFLSTASVKTKESPISTRVCEYIEEHLSEDFQISDIAEELNISVYYLSHVFKSATGTTITEYKNELRLTKAKLLLKNTDMRIGEIAAESGFGSVSYFTETFTKAEKISPQKYRALHKEI